MVLPNWSNLMVLLDLAIARLSYSIVTAIGQLTQLSMAGYHCGYFREKVWNERHSS